MLRKTLIIKHDESNGLGYTGNEKRRESNFSFVYKKIPTFEWIDNKVHSVEIKNKSREKFISDTPVNWQFSFYDSFSAK